MSAGPGRRYLLLVVLLVALTAVPVYAVVRAGTRVLNRHGALPGTSPFLMPERPVPVLPLPAPPTAAPTPGPTAPAGSGSAAPGSTTPAPTSGSSTPAGGCGTGCTGGPAASPPRYTTPWIWRPPTTTGGVTGTGTWRWSTGAPKGPGLPAPSGGAPLIVDAAGVDAVLGPR